MRQASAVAAAITQLYADIYPSLRNVLGDGHYGGLLLSLLLWKYLSDVDIDRRAQYSSQYGAQSSVVDDLMLAEPFTLPMGAAFDDVYHDREERVSAGGLAFVFREIERANPRMLLDVLRTPATTVLGVTLQESASRPLKDILLVVMERLSQPGLDFRPSSGVSSEVVGGAYEEIICSFAAHEDPVAVSASVPPALCDLVAELAQPREYESIYDPNCGSGGFLLSCAQFIRNQFGSKKYTLNGQVESLSSLALARASMIAHADFESSIAGGDVLGSPANVDDADALKRFDVVVGRVPFQLEQWDQQLGVDDKYGRFPWGVPVKSKPDYAYISHMIASIKEAGRMVVIAPLGVLFRGYAESAIRQALITENLLDAVIRLPDRLFYDNAVSAVVLIFKKGRSENNVLIIDASNEFTFGRRHNVMQGEHIGKIVATYRHRQEVVEFSRLVSIGEIRANDYNLNISRYIYNKPPLTVGSIADIRAEAQLEDRLSVVRDRVSEYLKIVD